MEKPLKAYYIITAKVHDFEKLKLYGMTAAPITKKYGGKAIISDKNPENLEGAIQGNLNVVIEFPSREKALGWYNDVDYAEAKKIRLEASEAISFLLVEEKK
ncbi:DUF1330 domain-containing protein [bacterium]|nr:DUF1330 domain-containing protein [bacterium]